MLILYLQKWARFVQLIMVFWCQTGGGNRGFSTTCQLPQAQTGGHRAPTRDPLPRTPALTAPPPTALPAQGHVTTHDSVDRTRLFDNLILAYARLARMADKRHACKSIPRVHIDRMVNSKSNGVTPIKKEK